MPGTNNRYDLADWIFNADTAIIIKLWYQALIGQGTPPTGGGLPVVVTPTTVNGVQVVGITETRTYQNALTTTPNSISAGKIGFTILFSSDFVGTIGGIPFTGATQAAYSDSAQPGNLLPAVAITRSAGTYSIIIAGAN